MMIRVTQQLMTSTLKRNLADSTDAVYQLQNKIAVSRRLIIPSDNPVDFATALNMRDAVGVAQRFQQNSQDTVDWLTVTETGVKSTGDMVQQVRQLVTQAANDSLTSDERKNLASQVNQLLEQMVSTANSDNGGRFVFAGHEVLQAPFVASRRPDGEIDSVTYRGDDGQMRREVMTNSVLPANVTGRELFLASTHTVRARAGAPVFADASLQLGDPAQGAIAGALFPAGVTTTAISLNGKAFMLSATQTVNEVARTISEDPTAHVTVTVEDTPGGVVPAGKRLVFTHDNGDQAISFDYVSGPQAAGPIPPQWTLGAAGTIYVEGTQVALLAGDTLATIATKINTALTGAGITNVTADVLSGPGTDQLRIVGPQGQQVDLRDGTTPLFATISPGSFQQVTGLTDNLDHIVGDQQGPYNIFETLIRLRNDLEAGDAPAFQPSHSVVGAGTVTGVVDSTGTLSGQFTITTDAAGQAAVNFGAVPPTSGVFYDPTYLSLPPNTDQQRQLDLLNCVVVEGTTYIPNADTPLSDPSFVNPTPPPGWTASPAVGAFTVNGQAFNYTGSESLRDLATMISGNPAANCQATVSQDGNLILQSRNNTPVSITDVPGGVMESLGLTVAGGASTKLLPLKRDSLSTFGITLDIGAPVAGTQVLAYGPVTENHRAENLTDIGLTTRVTGGGILDAYGKPSDTRSGTHRITVTGPITYGVPVSGGTAGVTVAASTMQAGATFSFSLTAGVVDAGTVRYVPNSNGGRPPTAEELAQLNTLNAGGALAAGSLSEFGLTLGGALGGTGTVTLTIPPATAQVQDEFSPADGTPPVVTLDTITAFSKNELKQSIPGPGAVVITGELVQSGQAILTSTSRVRELDLDLQQQLNVDATIGSRSNRATANLTALGQDVVNFKALMSKMEDLDVPSALVDLNDQENVYKSALAVGARVIMPTLMDFLATGA